MVCCLVNLLNKKTKAPNEDLKGMKRNEFREETEQKSKMIVFKFADCPKEKWRKGMQCVTTFPGVHTASGLVPNFFAVKGKSIDEEKLLRKLTKILKYVEIIDPLECREGQFFPVFTV
ncbi:PREDICTED: uncharacterized protein LOC104725778 [Camelina sativa]|uniref:Uncharacterized protein LOC104725778 n=1 Tax=Camelina sativa TaxID=90675 RepID=A0ABM0UL85_CAMSA|nr:PREDICTED: uncharacterized protein LOC104725778 [Camelina sativa]